jgi:Asp/Glu/hydantoin racemase
MAAFLPDATTWNIIDDRLLQDATREGGVTVPFIAARMDRLIEHARLGGADAIVVTCSMYASVAHRAHANSPIPILGADDALFDAVALGGYKRILVISSGNQPLADSLQRLAQHAGPALTLEGIVPEGSFEAARAGDTAVLTNAIVTAVRNASEAPDAIVLSQYSLAPAAESVHTATGLPVLTGPELAVKSLRRHFGKVSE